MRWPIVFALVTCIAGAGAAGAATVDPPGSALSFDLLARLAPRDGNVCFAPSSLSDALELALLGARGDTARQLTRALGLPATGEVRRSDAGWDGWARACALWVDAGCPVRDSFVAACASRRSAVLERADFARAPEAARRAINRWAAVATAGKVSALLGPQNVTARTRLVLASAVHFEGAWRVRFDAAATAPGPFTLGGDQRVPVSMMHVTGTFAWAQRDGVQALELPYEDGRIAMWVVLPRPGKTAVDLDQAALAALLDAARAERVAVTLPRFRSQTSYELAGVLKSAGIEDAFTDRADFSGLTTAPVKLDEVVHRASVVVDERGTAAAAASAVLMIPRGLARPRTFTADRPFLYFIVERTARTILFAGRMSDPRRP